MKYKNYLYRIRNSKDPNQLFVLSRGYEFEVEGLTGLALVRISSEEDSTLFNGNWSILDINSGLYVFENKSKKKLLETWNERFNNPDYDLINKILKARKTDSYIKAVLLLNDDKKLWREAGYLIEGR